MSHARKLAPQSRAHILVPNTAFACVQSFRVRVRACIDPRRLRLSVALLLASVL